MTTMVRIVGVVSITLILFAFYALTFELGQLALK